MKKVLLTLAALFMVGTMSAQTLLEEGFDNGIPSGWTMFNDNHNAHNTYYTDAWAANPSSGNPAPCVASTSWFDDAGQADRWLITPAIAITSNAFAFEIEAACYEAAYPDGFQVKVSTTSNSSRSEFTQTILNVPACSDQWTSYSADLSAFEGETIYIAIIQNSNDMNLLFVDNVKVFAIQENEANLVNFSMPLYLEAGSSSPISATVKNLGSSPLTSFDATVVINGTTTYTQSVSGINVPYGATHTFTFADQFAETTPGIYNFALNIANINGVADCATTLNAVTTVYNASDRVERKVVMEHFTTAQCPNCPDADHNLHNATHNRNDIIWVSHHAGYYTDNLTIPFSNNYTDGALWFYNNGGQTYAPAIMLDRTYFQFSAEDPGPVTFPYPSNITSMFNTAKDVPTFLSISIDDVHFTGRTLNVTVSGRFNFDMAIESPRLTVYLIEDSIKMAQAGASGTFWHEHVLRAHLTEGWGDQTAITSTTTGSTFSKTYTYQFPENFRANQCRVVAFVNNKTNDPNNSRIYNATMTENLTSTASIDDAEATSLNVYPNPANNFVVIESNEAIREVRVINMMGQEVYNSQENGEQVVLNTTDFAAGLYVVSVRTENGTSVKRINVVK